MRRYLTILLALLFWATPVVWYRGQAQSVIGMNYGGDPTITVGFPYATGTYPVNTTFDRLYDSVRGATAHATWWSTLNPTAGTYTFTTNLDPILTAESSAGRITEYTLSGVPTYVNAAQKVTGSTQLAQFSTFLAAMMAHIAGNSQCFGYFSIWNEVNQPSTYWTGTATELAALATVAYPIIKSACPHTIVLTPSVTSGINVSSTPFPNGPFQYLAAYLAAGGSAVTDACNAHGYPQSPSLATANITLSLDPFLLTNTITNLKSICAAAGLAVDSYLDEGYACSDPASTSIPANNPTYAGCQAAQLTLAASLGIRSYANSFFGAGCTIPACGNEFSPTGPLHLTPTGLAKRNLLSWFAGATFTTPFARTAGTNLITTAPNAASVATGNLGGSGAGCPTPPAGSGSLPVGASPWALSAAASIAGGMSYYVTGPGTSGGLPYIDTRICGTDTSGANSDFIRMNNFTGAAVLGQNVVISACLGVAAGSLSGISSINLQINEYAAGPTYAGQFMVQSQIQPVSTTLVPITSQCFQTRYIMKSASAAFAVPYIVIQHYASLPIDLTLRIANPTLDVNSTLWSGVITRGAYSATIAADASGSGTITAPAGSLTYSGIDGIPRRTTAGSAIHLTASPILIENTLRTAWFPALINAFVVAPTLGGNDSNSGTVLSPFATLNKCHTSMQASPTIHTCYIRGPVSTASWSMGSNETWSYYPGDSAHSPVITSTSASAIGCFSGCTNITIKGLTLAGGNAAVAYFGINASNHINIWNNIFNVTVTQSFIGFNDDYLNLQGNTFNASTTSGINTVSIPMNDNTSHSNILVTDNTFNGCDRWCLEMQSIPGNAGSFTAIYIDRNIFTNFEGVHGVCEAGSPSVGAASLVYGPGSGNSIQGNTITIPSNANTCSIGMEMEVGGASVQSNTFNYVPINFQCCGATGGQYAGLNARFVSNTITIPTTNTSAGALGGVASFGADGGFSLPAQFTIGTNIIIGTGTNSVTGCLSGAATSPGYCGLGTNTFPALPPYTPPSPVYTP